MTATEVGYTGGKKAFPDYSAIGDHTEALKVTFDPAQTSYATLAAKFWSSHNPRSDNSYSCQVSFSSNRGPQRHRVVVLVVLMMMMVVVVVVVVVAVAMCLAAVVHAKWLQPPMMPPPPCALLPHNNVVPVLTATHCRTPPASNAHHACATRQYQNAIWYLNEEQLEIKCVRCLALPLADGKVLALLHLLLPG